MKGMEEKDEERKIKKRIISFEEKKYKVKEEKIMFMKKSVRVGNKEIRLKDMVKKEYIGSVKI